MLYLCCSTNRSILNHPCATRIYLYSSWFKSCSMLSSDTAKTYYCVTELADEEVTLMIMLGAKTYALPNNALEGIIDGQYEVFDNIPTKVHTAALAWALNIPD